MIRNCLLESQLSDHQKIQKLQQLRNSSLGKHDCRNYLLFHLSPVPIVLERCLNIGKGFEKPCFEIFIKGQVLNMKIVMEPLRNP